MDSGLEAAALATLAAQSFTSTATRQRATVNFKGLRLPQAPMRAHYSWDSLWRYTQGVRKFAGALKWKAARLEGVMNIQQTSFSHKVIGPDATAAAASAGAGAAAGRPTLQFQESIDSVSGEEEGARMRAERHSPEVEAELDEWWALCRLVAATLAEPAPTAAVGRAAYCAMHMLMALESKVLSMRHDAYRRSAVLDASRPKRRDSTPPSAWSGAAVDLGLVAGLASPLLADTFAVNEWGA